MLDRGRGGTHGGDAVADGGCRGGRRRRRWRAGVAICDGSSRSAASPSATGRRLRQREPLPDRRRCAGRASGARRARTGRRRTGCRRSGSASRAAGARPSVGWSTSSSRPCEQRLLPGVDVVERAHLAGRHPGVGEQREPVLGRRRSAKCASSSAISSSRCGDPLRRWWRSAGRPGRARAPPQSARHSPSEPQAIWIGARAGREHAVRRDRRVVVAGQARAPRRRPSTGCPGRRARRPSRPAARCARRGRGRCASRSCSAASTPKAPFMPASRSAIGTPDLGRLLGAGDRHQAALALRDLVVAGPRRLRAVVAEAGDRQHHQAGVELVQPRDREAEPVEDARPGSSPSARRRAATSRASTSLVVRRS